jgi:hypothetical protein
VCGVSELRVKAKPHNKTEDLIQKIKEVVVSLDRDTVAKASKRYRPRIETMVIADGHFVV